MSSSFSQIILTTLPSGNNKKASVTERIGLTDVTIHYDRPGVKGREGKIWNTPVAHYGFVDQGHGTSYSAPWRAGANENTTISFSHPVSIEGKDLPAGKLYTVISADLTLKVGSLKGLLDAGKASLAEEVLLMALQLVG